jgi:alkanesulfonate monooxygenase SsuD/methylene tetrahydromethanopterin reductase-like flavin-dependent oxidoreductase (luciferase family)
VSAPPSEKPRFRGLRLGVSLVGAGNHPGAWREPGVDPDRLFTGASLVDLVRSAELGGLDFVTVPDSFARSGDDGRLPGRLDALLSLARVAPVTRSIGLIPEVTTTHTEPFHVSKNLATLDFVSRGRAGWKVAVSRTQYEADLFGRKDAAPTADLYREAGEFVEVVARLWDSWEDDAVIRDRPTGRYIDREKLHYVDFDGEFFSVRGPSITPRSPQAHPIIAVDATDDAALPVATTFADLVFLDALDPDAARRRRDLIHAQAANRGRDPDRVTVLATVDVVLDPDPGAARATRARLDARVAPATALPRLAVTGTPALLADQLEEWWRAGAVDGFVLWPARLPTDVSPIVDIVIPALRDRGVVPPAPSPGETGTVSFRDRLGLDRPTNRYAETA